MAVALLPPREWRDGDNSTAEPVSQPGGNTVQDNARQPGVTVAGHTDGGDRPTDRSLPHDYFRLPARDSNQAHNADRIEHKNDQGIEPESEVLFPGAKDKPPQIDHR